MEKNILTDLKNLDKELTNGWLEMQNEHKSNKLYKEFIERKNKKDPYTLFAIGVGMYSGVTDVQGKIKEIIEKYDQ